jgi:hypothetical protein
MHLSQYLRRYYTHAYATVYVVSCRTLTERRGAAMRRVFHSATECPTSPVSRSIRDSSVRTCERPPLCPHHVGKRSVSVCCNWRPPSGNLWVSGLCACARSSSHGSSGCSDLFIVSSRGPVGTRHKTPPCFDLTGPFVNRKEARTSP